VYRDSKDEVGRAAFEVIRDPRLAIAPEGARIVAMPAAKGTAHSIAGGKAKARLLLDEEAIGSRDIYVGLLEAEPGAEVARHSHAGSEELLYVLSGDGGELTVGNDKIRFGPEQAIHLPEDQPHAVKFHGDSKTVMLHIYAPAGRQRFKGRGRRRANELRSRRTS
jgi:quercetin dioxygenase-like cupin family protein